MEGRSGGQYRDDGESPMVIEDVLKATLICRPPDQAANNYLFKTHELIMGILNTLLLGNTCSFSLVVQKFNLLAQFVNRKTKHYANKSQMDYKRSTDIIK